jgi:uncharacterized protein
MKRIFIIALLLCCLLLSTSARELQHVSDLANVLSDSEETRLQRQAAELYSLTGFDVVIHTTNDSQGKTPFEYSMDYYQSFRDPALTPDGALLAVMFDTRKYHEAARGEGISLLTHRESHDLANVVKNKLSNDKYYNAFNSYIRYVKRLLIPPTPFERAVELLPFIVIAGLVIGLFYALYLKSKLKIAKYRYDAHQYVTPNSLNLTASQDIYLYQTVTRTKIESKSSSGGGGSSSGSRGGTSYGGRGGSF